MNYKQTLEYLYSQLPVYHRIGPAAYKADLKNTLELCNLLGNPQNNFKSIHVGGTNGKGSVSHFLASILQTSGLKVGLYTSPHLKDFRERIKINGKLIPEDYVKGFVNNYRKQFETSGMSFFEMTVGLAFRYFSDEKVDIAVIEVGLGGRLDSTNIITPLLTVITNISFDHMALLGDTLRQIAGEKAGIIKRGVPVVIGETQEEIKDIFTDKAGELNAAIYFADKSFRLSEVNLQSSAVSYKVSSFNIQHPTFNISSPLTGNYQRKNIVTVIQAVEVLNNLPAINYQLSTVNILKGIEDVIKNTGLMGRWQILSQSPLTIFDVGHNEAGIREVVQQISLTPHKKLHFVFGMVNDKETGKILSLLPKDAEYYFCKADIPRGLDQEILAENANKIGLKGKAYLSVKEAFMKARKNAEKDDLIFVGGSVFVVAEVI
jgi:dihydrofolate synthase / folylpolyglutamate synthase